jgi:hypothetical protein
MQDDIVERLNYAGDEAPDNLISLIWEAAKEIERLRAALRTCEAVPLPPEVRTVIRAALEGCDG